MEVSNEERVRIATDFIKAAPPGEFKEVVSDVRVLLGDDSLLSKASGVFYEYATEQFTTVDLPDGERALVTKLGHISDNTFYDPRSRKTFKYDYLKNEARDVAEMEDAPPEGAEKWRSAVQVALKPYLDDWFPNHYSAVYGKVERGEVCITVCLEDHKYNPSNFWNGKWISKWELVFAEGGSQGDVKGMMNVKVHYYEDGNVQLLSNKSVEDKVEISSPSEVAKSLVAIIKKSEAEYQMAINENYKSMSNTTFKALRRNLPVTQSLIDWHKLHGLQVGKDIMNR